MQSNTLLSNILKSIGSILVVLDKNGFITEFNKASEIITGYSFEEVKNKHITEVLLHETDIDHVMIVFNDLVNTKKESQYENNILTKDGNLRYISWKNTVIKDNQGNADYVVASGIDITEQRLAESKLKESENRNQILIDSAPFGIVIVQKKIIKFTNPKFNRIIGYENNEIVGKNFDYLLPFENKNEVIVDVYNRPSNLNRPEIFQINIKHKNGRLIPVKIDMMWIELPDGKGSLSFIEDLTLQIKAEHEKKLFNEQKQIIQRFKSLSNLSGGLAHDFNNLLTGIIDNVYIALNELPVESSVNEQLRDIEEICDRAVKIIDRIQAFSGQTRTNTGSHDLTLLIKEIVSSIKEFIPSSIECKLDLDANIPNIILDPSQIQEILNNIIINAVEAIGEKNGRIEIKTEQVNVNQKYIESHILHIDIPTGQYITISIEDNGIGIDLEDIDLVFDPFYTTKFAGRGLGLGVAQGFVRTHNGSITVKSEKGVGSTFTILLPVCAKEEMIKEKMDDFQLINGQIVILVVDDESSIRKIIKRGLQKYGINILTSNDGIEGLKKFKQNLDIINLVISDLTMPNMNGIQLINEIYKIKPNIPVILISGYSEENVKKDIQGNLISFIHKPFTLKYLKDTIDRILKLQ